MNRTPIASLARSPSLLVPFRKPPQKSDAGAGVLVAGAEAIRVDRLRSAARGSERQCRVWIAVNESG
jgi:hypothetical protein